MFRFLGRVHWRDWLWVHFKVCLGIVFPALTMLTMSTPGIQTPIAAPLLLSWFGMAMAGALLSIGGIIAQAQRGKWAVIGLPVELTGLIFMFTGPFLYCTALVYQGFTAGDWRWTGIAFCWSLVAALLARAGMVIPRYWQEAHDESKDV